LDGCQLDECQLLLSVWSGEMLAVRQMSKIDDLARSLAERTSPAGTPGRRRAQPTDLDQIARVFAAPMSRRRVFRLGAAAAGASLFTLPSRAHAQADDDPCPTCASRPGTQPCCVRFGNGLARVAIGQCYDPNTQECCTGTSPDDGLPTAWICSQGTTCAGDGRCVCRRQLCGGVCCAEDEDCIVEDLFTPDNDLCAKRCPPGQNHCRSLQSGFGAEPGECCPSFQNCCGDGCCLGRCCKKGGEAWCCEDTNICSDIPGLCGCPQSQRCGQNCCEPGAVCCRVSLAGELGGRRLGAAAYVCCSPGLEKELLDALEKFLHLEPLPLWGEAAGASGQAARRQRARASASAGAADALVALGAVQGRGALAADLLRSGRPDSSYRKPVKAGKPALTPVAPGPGLDAAAAQALNKLLAAEARAWALLNAAATAYARSLGAIRASNVRAARGQARAYGKFAGKAAKALRPIPRLRAAAAAALQGGGTPEVTVTARQVADFQAAVRRGGLPADLRARLTQLGLGRAEQRKVARLIVGTDPQRVAGDVLIAPLANASRRSAVAKLSTLLARQAARSRTRPITVSKRRPRNVRGTAPRPHTSQSSRRR